MLAQLPCSLVLFPSSLVSSCSALHILIDISRTVSTVIHEHTHRPSHGTCKVLTVNNI